MTNKLLAAAAAATLFAIPAAAQAQQLPAAVVAVVNVDRVTNECNACKTALSQLNTQLNAIKGLQNQLAAPLEAEQKSLQTAIAALNGKNPDAALTARVQAFEKKQADANRQLAQRDQAFQANRNYVMQQISTKLDPALTTVLAKRGATLMLDGRVALKVSPAIDVTGDVLAQLNSTLTSIATTAPAAAPAKPAGR